MGLKAVKNMTIKEIQREIKQTNEDLEHPYWIDHPKHKTAVDRMMDLLTALSKKLHPPGKSKHPAPKRSPLGNLVDFLNIDFESASAWERWKEVNRSFSTEKIDRSDELIKARDLQSEINHDLSPIADSKGIPKEHFGYDERWFELCEKLNEMNFQRRWQVDIEALAQRKDFFIPKFESWNLTRDDREKWYALVGYLLENGDIGRLRKCSFCRIFFEARDGRQRFCKEECKDNFHKRTAADRMRKSREKQRREEKRQAKERQKRQKDRVLEQKFKVLVMEVVEQRRRGSLVTKLGQGQYSAGWNTVMSWADQIKRGVSLREIIWGLSEKHKSILDEHFSREAG